MRSHSKGQAAPEERAREICLRSLEHRMRTRHELQLVLTRKQVDPEVAFGVLNRLAELGLIDDERYARTYVETRQRTRPRGPRALRNELLKKGVPDGIIDRVLEEQRAAEDPVETARRAVSGKLRTLAGRPASEVRRKAEQFLLRRGFSYEVARDALSGVEEDEGGE